MDTDVFSYMMKPGDPRAAVYEPHLRGKLLAVSFITVGELLFGAKKKKWGARKLEDLRVRLGAVTIVPYDYSVCSTYADLKMILESEGKKKADNDLWIASCALSHSIPLVSNNRSHFEGIPGLVLISEAPVN